MVIECQGCGAEFEARSKTAKYCGAACRKRGSRKTKASEQGSSVPAGYLAAVEAELVKMGKLDTAIGQEVMIVAARIASPFSTGTEVSSLTKERTRLMGLLSAGGAKGSSPVDEMKARREAKARKATG